MSRLAKLRRRTDGSNGVGEQILQQQLQFGYLGARLRNLRDLDAVVVPRAPPEQTTTKKRSRKPRKNAPPSTPGYVYLLTELRERAHLQRVDHTLEHLREHQERHRHLVSSAKSLVPLDTRRHYVWKTPQARADVVWRYQRADFSPSTSLWTMLQQFDAAHPRPVSHRARAAAHPSVAAAAAAPGETPEPSRDIAVAFDDVPIAARAINLPHPPRPATDLALFTDISTDVQRRWLQDKIRAIDLVPPETHALLDPDVRALLTSVPSRPLWPHQVEAMQFMLHCEGHMRFGSRAAIVADEMGFGKTRLMIEIVYRTRQLLLLRDPTRRRHRPTLLIVPNSISYHPARELANAYPPDLLRVIRMCDGENRGVSPTDIEAHVDLIITTYSTISHAYANYTQPGTGYEVLFDLNYERIVADEGHVFANPHTIVNGAAMALSARSAHNWFFSGTPIQNRFSDIDAALRFIGIADTYIPRAPVVRVHAQNLLEIQCRLEEMERGLQSAAARAEFRDLWGVLAGQTTTTSDRPALDEWGEGEEEEEDYLADVEYEKKEKKKKKKRAPHHSHVHITQRGVRHFLEMYRCRSVMQGGRTRANGVDALVEVIIAEVYRTLEATGGKELEAYTAKINELLGTCMLRRTRASIGSAFGRKIKPHARVTVTLPRNRTVTLEADAEGFLGPRYLRTHALFSRESDPFSEQLLFYARDSAEALLYGFYDSQRLELTLHPHAQNIFEHDVSETGPFNPNTYTLVQAAVERADITAAYLAQRGEAATELDRQVCRLYDRHFSQQNSKRSRARPKAETRTLVAQRSLMAICNQLGTCKRIFLPPFLDPPDATSSPAALFTQRTEYYRLTRLEPSVLEYCQATARELKLAGTDGIWDGARRLQLPTESTQFREIKRRLQALRPGEKMIVPFNSVETLLQLYFYITEWFPLLDDDDDEDAPHIQPLVLVGAMDAAERRVAMERFETDPNYNVLLASMQVISLGHNLGMANIVLAPDSGYNPQHLRQCTFRPARPDQERHILLCVIIPLGTMVEYALLVGHGKMSKEEAAIGGERVSSRAVARSRRGGSRVLNYIDACRARELDGLTRVT